MPNLSTVYLPNAFKYKNNVRKNSMSSIVW